MERLRTETPDKSKSPKVVEDTIVELVLDLSDRHDVHAVGIGAAAGSTPTATACCSPPPVLAQRAAARPPRRPARRPGPGRQRRNSAAWAEWRFGAGRGEDHLVMITLGTGIGGAILEDGQVKRGKYGVAGEFGHMQVVPGGHRCPCGNRGCWEQYSSGNALVREARELAAADSPVAYGIIEHVKGNIADISGPMITELAREGDAMCIELLQDIGQWLGVGIANLAAALDPSCFVIGGGVSAADDLLIGPARDAFKRHLTGRGYRPEAHIVRAQLGPEAGMVGRRRPRPSGRPPLPPRQAPPGRTLRALRAVRGGPPHHPGVPVTGDLSQQPGVRANPARPRTGATDPPQGTHPADHRAAHRRPGRLSGDLGEPEPGQRQGQGGEVLRDRPHRGLAVQAPAPHH
ncbi:ROK family protein, partial [Microbacterium terregens]|uniref:ROK family protein n=1 Tax=Microbacterium terregens TaxID=69363 RepID=UPI0031DCC986